MSIPIRVGAYELCTRSIAEKNSIAECIVTISTGNIKDAGTDADVRFEIGGASTLLDKPNYDDFERGDTDTYNLIIPSGMTLDDLRKSRIRLSHNDARDYSGWYVLNVVLQVRIANANQFAPYKRWGTIGWLAKDEPPYYTTEAILQDGTELLPTK